MKNIFMPMFFLLFSFNLFAKTGLSIDGFAKTFGPKAKMSAAYITVKNLTKKDIALIKATSTHSPNVEFHDHIMKGDLIKMVQVPKIDVKKNSTLTMKPGGLHIMIMNLSQPLIKGKKFNVTFYDSNKNQYKVSLPIKGF